MSRPAELVKLLLIRFQFHIGKMTRYLNSLSFDYVQFPITWKNAINLTLTKSIKLINKRFRYSIEIYCAFAFARYSSHRITSHCTLYYQLAALVALGIQ